MLSLLRNTTRRYTVSIFLFSCMKPSGELNQCADSEMPPSRASGNAPERLGDLLRGEAGAKSPTLIRKSCAGSWVQQRALNLRAVGLRLPQHRGSMCRKDLSSPSAQQPRPVSGVCTQYVSECLWTCIKCTYMWNTFNLLICIFLPCRNAFLWHTSGNVDSKAFGTNLSASFVGGLAGSFLCV